MNDPAHSKHVVAMTGFRLLLVFLPVAMAVYFFRPQAWHAPREASPMEAL